MLQVQVFTTCQFALCPAVNETSEIITIAEPDSSVVRQMLSWLCILSDFGPVA